MLNNHVYFEFHTDGAQKPLPMTFENEGAAWRWLSSYCEKHPEHSKKLNLNKVTVTVTKENVNV